MNKRDRILHIENVNESEVSFYESNNLRLIRDLELHQLELKAQYQELKLAKERAELAEKKYIELYDFAPAGHLSLTKSGIIINLNLSAGRFLGKVRSSLIDSNFGFFVSPETRAVYNNFIQQIFKTNLKQTCEFKLVTDDDSVKCVLANGITSNTEEKCLVILTDITKLKSAQKIMSESEEKFKVITENSADAIFITNVKGEYVYVNKQAINLFGYSKEEMLDMTFADVSPTERMEVNRKMFHKLLEEGKAYFETEVVKRDGALLDVDVNSILLPDGFIYGSCRDISERKKTLILIHDSEEKYRSVIEAASDAIVTTDYYGSIVDWNLAAEKIFGYTAIEIIGEKLDNIIPQSYSMISKDGTNRVVLGGKHPVPGKTIELAGLHKDGHEFPIELSLSLWGKSSEKFFTGIIRDITERRQKEEELIKAKLKAEESDRLKSAFLTNMSHEIRTPMNGILGFTELLKAPLLTGEEKQDYIQVIQTSGERMLNTINDIVNMSQIESGQNEISVSVTNVNEQIAHVYKFFKPETEQKSLHLSINDILPANKAFIRTDREKLYTVLTNLVKNAIKFTKTGSVELGCEIKGEFIEFYVKDSGDGIPDEQKDFIFERFRQGNDGLTRNYEGSGLGLAVAKGYVDMLGGKIWVESDPDSHLDGKGSTFRFTLPLLSEIEKKEVLKVVAKKKVNPNGMKILVVDDDEISRFLINLMLKPLKSQIIFVTNGLDAVKTCRQNPDINLVLMDIKMQGIDGYETTRQIREFNKEIVIIAQTAFALGGDRDDAINAGCNNYIQKPLISETLLNLINQYVN